MISFSSAITNWDGKRQKLAQWYPLTFWFDKRRILVRWRWFHQRSTTGSTVITVEHTPYNREVVGSIPTGCWAFFSFYPQKCVLKQVPRGSAALLLILRKINAAWGETSLISSIHTVRNLKNQRSTNTSHGRAFNYLISLAALETTVMVTCKLTQ